jgi:hypothetical protein
MRVRIVPSASVAEFLKGGPQQAFDLKGIDAGVANSKGRKTEWLED